MAEITSLQNVLEEELRDIFNAENQLLKALPKMAKHASNENLRGAFQAHLAETEGQVERLHRIGELLNFKLGGKVCKAMQGLIEEGKEVLEEESSEPALLDAMLIGAAQRVEHYEMAAYGTAIAMARQLGFDEVVELLEETLGEEEVADEKLSTISESEVLTQAGLGSEEETEEEDEDNVKKSTSAKRNGKNRGETRERL
ncbi:MAG: DUF892 family protein [Deltaproteobacteria bacterium]|nr:DUF892 family protein [Deltaproteobacteria bacterium]